MKRIFDFLKATAQGGLFVLLPLLLLFLLLAEVMELLVGIATPIADLFPQGTFDLDARGFEGIAAGQPAKRVFKAVCQKNNAPERTVGRQAFIFGNIENRPTDVGNRLYGSR